MDISQINTKYVNGRSDMTMWNVPANMITVYAGA